MLETRGIVVTWLSDIFHMSCFVYLVYDLRVLLIDVYHFFPYVIHKFGDEIYARFRKNGYI